MSADPSLLPIPSLDDLRARHPDLGFAVYAYAPGESLSFEILTPDGQTYLFKNETLAGAIELAFPPAPAPPASDVFD